MDTSAWVVLVCLVVAGLPGIVHALRRRARQHELDFNIIDEAIHYLDTEDEPWTVHVEARVSGALDEKRLRAAIAEALTRWRAPSSCDGARGIPSTAGESTRHRCSIRSPSRRALPTTRCRRAPCALPEHPRSHHRGAAVSRRAGATPFRRLRDVEREPVDAGATRGE